jgi:hypothetical protein
MIKVTEAKEVIKFHCTEAKEVTSTDRILAHTI